MVALETKMHVLLLSYKIELPQSQTIVKNNRLLDNSHLGLPGT